MSEPEISRRCLSCGASVRRRGLFCPECGKRLENPVETTVEQSKATATPSNGEAHRLGAVKVVAVWPASPREASVSGLAGDAARPEAASDYSHRRGTPGKLHRATEAARRELEESVLPQVQRLRQVSSVVLEEASYDPSLRFVLVAAVLFVIFVVVLALSKVMG